MTRDAQILEELEHDGSLRELRSVKSCGAYLEYKDERYVNLSSNDYLGLSDSDLQRRFFETVDTESCFMMSNPSSRLMTGNSEEYEALEAAIANFHGADAALVVSSGFLLNSGILPAVTTAKDLIITDKLMHASLIDGMRLSQAKHERFRHNDMNHLERLLQHADAERVIVATESVFSMDGDRAPLEDIARLQQRYDFELYLDEAHAIGVQGCNGAGLSTLFPDLRVDYLVATMGKAVCSQGAYVVCSEQKRNLLINKMRTLIFSTALPPLSLSWSRFVIQRMAEFEARREHLRELIEMMKGETHIIPMIIGENQKTLERAEQLRKAGFWVTAIRQPTVAAGSARLRFSLTAAHSKQQIEKLLLELSRDSITNI